MKETGIEWIGAIPDSWRLNKIGQLFNLRNEKVSDKVYAPLSVSRGGVVPQMESVAKSDASDDRKLVLVGDFAINSRSDRKQSCGVSPLDGSVSLINLILYAKDGNAIYNDYMNYLLKNYGFAEEFYRWGHGIVADLWTTRWQEMKNIMLPLPSVEMQKKLFEYLTEKSAEIDRLIEIENQQIEKLKEYKQAVITEAVTKGLDKSAPMKDSGVDWIGEIPQGWKVVKLKNLFKNVSIKNHGKDTVLSVYRDYGVLPKDSRDDNFNVTSLDTDSYKYVENGDLVINKMKAWSGSLSISNYTGIVSPAYYVCKVDYSKVDKRFIHNFLRNKYLVSYYAMLSSGLRIGQWDLSIDDFLSIKIALPLLEKQQKIARAIDDKSEEIDSLIEIKQKKIDELNEYKKSLIYEYVTGKKEVV